MRWSRTPLFWLGVTVISLAQAQNSIPQTSILDQDAHLPLQRLPITSKTPSGYTPQQMLHAYGLDQVPNQGAGQIIGIVDAFDYPEVESDLAVFDTQFGLPACTQSNGCLMVVYASGSKPRKNPGWTGETSLDVQWAHAIAPQAKIVLVETSEGSTRSLLQGVLVAVQNGASSVNMSWGTPKEFPFENSLDPIYFNNAAVTYINASGDEGNGSFGYPGASPLVVGAGGTTLKLTESGDIQSETAWSGSGGGTSTFFAEPIYQVGVQTSGRRGVPDVSYNADPQTGVPVYDSELGAWAQVGGTSASSPQWCAITAIVNSIRAGLGKAPIGANFLRVIYDNPSTLRDITQGKNGTCAECSAGPGYDFVTGLGSPMAVQVVEALTSAP